MLGDMDERGRAGGEGGRTRGTGGLPPGPGGVFGLRNLMRFSRGPLELLRQLADEHGDAVRFRMIGSEWVMLNHPEDIEAALVKNARVMGRDEYVEVLERALGLGLLTSDGDLWKRQRKLMSQAFTPRRIHEYARTMVEVTERALGSWRHGEVINVHQEMSRVTMEVVAAVLFGAEMRPGDVDVVREAMEVVNEFFANSPEAVLRIPERVPTPRNRRFRSAIRAIDAVVYEIVGQRRRSGETKDDLLGTLLAAQDDEGARMSDRQLRDEAITLFLAGHETTALTLAHTLYLLSTHPDVERRVAAEVATVLGERPPAGEDVRALPYVDRVLKESMRLYPPAWTTGREATEDVEIGGWKLRRGTQVLLSQWVVHRDPRWFPNPEGFDPDRWLPERAASLPRYAYFPFGGGPRTCIGNHFATMEAALILAMIEQRWRVELLPGERLELRPSVTLRQRGPGLRAKLVDRRIEAGAARSEPRRDVAHVA